MNELVDIMLESYYGVTCVGRQGPLFHILVLIERRSVIDDSKTYNADIIVFIGDKDVVANF